MVSEKLNISQKQEILIHECELSKSFSLNCTIILYIIFFPLYDVKSQNCQMTYRPQEKDSYSFTVSMGVPDLRSNSHFPIALNLFLIDYSLIYPHNIFWSPG